MAHWSEGTIRANGIDIHYLRTGGGRPPVVLLHGFTDNGACWSRLARDLEADYDLIMPDARGHGRSSAPERGYSAAEQAADVIGLIDALGLDRPALIGHSMGGRTAALVAADAPEQIRGVILEDPGLGRDDAALPPSAKAEWLARQEAARAMSEEALAALAQAQSPHWSADTFAPWARAKHELSVRAFELLDYPHADGPALVARFGVPALLATGDPAQGVLISPELAAELQALSPRLRVAHFAGAGHCIRYEQPEAFAAAARAFLAELYA